MSNTTEHLQSLSKNCVAFVSAIRENMSTIKITPDYYDSLFEIKSESGGYIVAFQHTGNNFVFECTKYYNNPDNTVLDQILGDIETLDINDSNVTQYSDDLHEFGTRPSKETLIKHFTDKRNYNIYPVFKFNFQDNKRLISLYKDKPNATISGINMKIDPLHGVDRVLKYSLQDGSSYLTTDKNQYSAFFDLIGYDYSEIDADLDRYVIGLYPTIDKHFNNIYVSMLKEKGFDNEFYDGYDKTVTVYKNKSDFKVLSIQTEKYNLFALKNDNEFIVIDQGKSYKDDINLEEIDIKNELNKLTGKTLIESGLTSGLHHASTNSISPKYYPDLYCLIQADIGDLYELSSVSMHIKDEKVLISSDIFWLIEHIFYQADNEMENLTNN